MGVLGRLGRLLLLGLLGRLGNKARVGLHARLLTRGKVRRTLRHSLFLVLLLRLLRNLLPLGRGQLRDLSHLRLERWVGLNEAHARLGAKDHVARLRLLRVGVLGRLLLRLLYLVGRRLLHLLDLLLLALLSEHQALGLGDWPCGRLRFLRLRRRRLCCRILNIFGLRCRLLGLPLLIRQCHAGALAQRSCRRWRLCALLSRAAARHRFVGRRLEKPCPCACQHFCERAWRE